VTLVPTIDETRAQAAVEAATRRVSALVRSMRHPSARALGRWSAVEVAAHLSHALDAIGAMAEGGGGLLDGLSALSRLTESLVEGETERDPAVLADRIEASSARLLSIVRSGDREARRPWLVAGVEVPLSVLACHALNELVVHGRDIAVAEGIPWPVPRYEAALVVCGFLFPVLDRVGSTMLAPSAAGVRVTYDVRVRGGCRVALRFAGGELSVTGPASDGVDCHLSVDPAGFLMVAWARVDQWQAIRRGQLLAWGRRPWLGLELRTLLTNP
jgi:uncharacterized protein (TIGR03083 family)